MIYSNKNRIAICYDFDKTLTPVEMQVQGFSNDVGYQSSSEFWNEINKFSIANKIENNLGYMYKMIEMAKENGFKITKPYLESLGKKIKFFDGVDTWFERINDYGESNSIEIQHYIISSGLKEIIEATSISKYFDKIYASAFYYKKEEAVWPSWAINYTNKTQYVFRISKGVFDELDNSVNDNMDHNDYNVPLTNFIYIGDSDTDVPCMTLIKKSGGTSIGVYGEYNKTLERKLLGDKRIDSYVKADYTDGSSLEMTVKKAIISAVRKSYI